MRPVAPHARGVEGQQKEDVEIHPRLFGRDDSDGLLVSCLCVTESRPSFIPWLLWNFRKQDYPARELIVVDSSPHSLSSILPADVTIVRCPPGTSVARKRNVAWEAARGEFVAWFDDDDWQHPRRLSILTDALAGGAVLAGSRRSWFIDMSGLRARPHEGQRGVLFNGAAVRRTSLVGVRFDERRTRASDTPWMTLVRQRAGSVRVVADVLSCWLCHRNNLSNPSSRYIFRHRLDDVRRAVGLDAWGDTDDELAALRVRLSHASARPGSRQG